MEIENLIERIKIEYDDVKNQKADYVSIAIEDVEAILEYLEQLNTLKED